MDRERERKLKILQIRSKTLQIQRKEHTSQSSLARAVPGPVPTERPEDKIQYLIISTTTNTK